MYRALQDLVFASHSFAQTLSFAMHIAKHTWHAFVCLCALLGCVVSMISAFYVRFGRWFIPVWHKSID